MAKKKSSGKDSSKASLKAAKKAKAAQKVERKEKKKVSKTKDEFDDDVLLRVRVARVRARFDVLRGLLDELLHARFDCLPVGADGLLVFDAA